MDFTYIIGKINNSEFSEFPFKHLEINELFHNDDFEEIIKSPEITTKAVLDDKALFDQLFANKYKIISFPGCTENYKEYIAWHKDKKVLIHLVRHVKAMEWFCDLNRQNRPPSAH